MESLVLQRAARHGGIVGVPPVRQLLLVMCLGYCGIIRMLGSAVDQALAILLGSCFAFLWSARSSGLGFGFLGPFALVLCLSSTCYHLV